MSKALTKTLNILKIWFPPILWALVIFTFSSLSVGKAGGEYWKDFVIKKTAHLIEYGILASLIYRSMLLSKVSKKKALIWSIVIAALYGASDEFHQSFTPGREPRIRDVFIDTIGATLGVILWRKQLS